MLSWLALTTAYSENTTQVMNTITLSIWFAGSSENPDTDTHTHTHTQQMYTDRHTQTDRHTHRQTDTHTQ